MIEFNDQDSDDDYTLPRFEQFEQDLDTSKAIMACSLLAEYFLENDFNFTLGEAEYAEGLLEIEIFNVDLLNSEKDLKALLFIRTCCKNFGGVVTLLKLSTENVEIPTDALISYLNMLNVNQTEENENFFFAPGDFENVDLTTLVIQIRFPNSMNVRPKNN